MAGINRRNALKILTSAPMAAGFAWTEAEAQEAHHLAQAAQKTAQAGTAFSPKFFNAHEWATVRALVDLIIPRDERSGSASDAGVPEFMDFMMLDQPERQTAMRGGLAWLDLELLQRHDQTFVNGTAAQQAAILDDLAWPDRAKPQFSHGIAFFTSFRDLTATGFFTSKVGMEDLQYLGNKYVREWTGCPEEALNKLGVTYPPE